MSCVIRWPLTLYWKLLRSRPASSMLCKALSRTKFNQWVKWGAYHYPAMLTIPIDSHSKSPDGIVCEVSSTAYTTEFVVRHFCQPSFKFIRGLWVYTTHTNLRVSQCISTHKLTSPTLVGAEVFTVALPSWIEKVFLMSGSKSSLEHWTVSSAAISCLHQSSWYHPRVIQTYPG